MKTGGIGSNNASWNEESAPLRRNENRSSHDGPLETVQLQANRPRSFRPLNPGLNFLKRNGTSFAYWSRSVFSLHRATANRLRAELADRKNRSEPRRLPSHPTFRIIGSKCLDRGAPSCRSVTVTAATCATVKDATGFKYIRFHAIFHDEVGLYDEDTAGKPVYNFSYVDQIYDGLLENHVRPFVELQFHAPQKLAAAPTFPFLLVQAKCLSAERLRNKWDDLISHFARHLIERYGIDEVSQWYFEVWNEPNLDFWGGRPKDQIPITSFSKDGRNGQNSKAGGPAAARRRAGDGAGGVGRPLHSATVAENKVPVDFISTHVYANDLSEDVFGTHEKISRNEHGVPRGAEGS